MPCQLCGAEKVYQILSHYSPRAITKGTFGDTDKEAIYSISPYSGTLDSYKGRADPEADPEVIKPLPNTGKGIFCKRCENAFGIWENICQTPLNNNLENLYAGNLKITRVRKALKSFNIPIASNVMQLFLYSVVWRQCLQNKTDVGNSILSKEEFDYLQSILLKELFKDQKDIATSQGFPIYPRISIITSKRNIDRDGWVNPSPVETNPELFLLGKYLILYFKNGKDITKNLFTLLGIPTFLQSASINLQSGESESKIGLVPEKIHTHISTTFTKRAAADFANFYVVKVAKYRHINWKEANNLLNEKAAEVYKETQSHNYTECYIKAADLLCS